MKPEQVARKELRDSFLVADFDLGVFYTEQLQVGMRGNLVLDGTGGDEGVELSLRVCGG